MGPAGVATTLYEAWWMRYQLQQVCDFGVNNARPCSTEILWTSADILRGDVKEWLITSIALLTF